MEEMEESEPEESEDIMLKEEEMEEEEDKMAEKPKKESFNNMKKLKPASLQKDDEAQGETIDYASTLQQAYKNVENMLGKGGMKGLTKETKKLVDQQKELMETLNQMTPVLSDAKETLNNLNMPDIGSLQKMMGKLGAMK